MGMKKRKLFCEISSLTYKISMYKCRLFRHVKNLKTHRLIAKQISKDKLPIVIYKHNSLIRRKLGDVDLCLQDNKAINLNISSLKINGIIIKPNEIFSFWELVGICSKEKGYKQGLLISRGNISKGIGGGMCQLSNLIHWMVLHTPLEIIEHHHHDQIDMFPDYGRKVPFGTGTSIMYNHLDYRFKNNTNQPYQLIVYTDDEYLYGEIRTTKHLDIKFHINVENEKFIENGDDYFRTGKVYRRCIDKKDGKIISKELIKDNYAKVMYKI